VFWSPSTIHFFSFSDPLRNQLAGAADANRLKFGVDEAVPHTAKWLYAPTAPDAGRGLIVAGHLVLPMEYQKTSRSTSAKSRWFPTIFA
jgi:hypothetical protein